MARKAQKPEILPVDPGESLRQAQDVLNRMSQLVAQPIKVVKKSEAPPPEEDGVPSIPVSRKRRKTYTDRRPKSRTIECFRQALRANDDPNPGYGREGYQACQGFFAKMTDEQLYTWLKNNKHLDVEEDAWLDWLDDLESTLCEKDGKAKDRRSKKQMLSEEEALKRDLEDFQFPVDSYSFNPFSASLPTTQALEPDSTGANMAAAQNSFTYVKGTGKDNKAEYKFGKITIPAAAISRLEKEVAGETDTKKAMIFYSRLEKKYAKFLAALDAAKIEYAEALRQMAEVKPAKSQSTGVRASKVTITATALSKGICKRFKGNPDEMVADFVKTVNDPEFTKELTKILKSYQKKFGKTPLGHIKTSNREGNPKALAALAKYRKAKKK